MSKLKLIVSFIVTIVLLSVSPILAYDLLHDVAAGSGTILTNTVQVTFKDIAGHLNEDMQPSDTATITIGARYDFILAYDENGAISRDSNEFDGVYAFSRHADSDPYRDTVNGTSFYSYIQAKPADTVVIPWGIINVSNDSTTMSLSIIVEQNDYQGDSIWWQIDYDNGTVGDSDPADAAFLSLDTRTQITGLGTSNTVGSFDTLYMLTYTEINTNERRNTADTLTIAISVTQATPGEPQNPDTLYIVQAIEIAAPEIVISKNLVLADDANGVVKPGDTLMYIISDTNTGNASAYDVAMIDTLPSWDYDGDGNADTYVWLVATGGGCTMPGAWGDESADSISVSKDGTYFVSINNADSFSVRVDQQEYYIFSNVTHIQYFNSTFTSADKWNEGRYYIMVPWTR